MKLYYQLSHTSNIVFCSVRISLTAQLMIVLTVFLNRSLWLLLQVATQ